MARKADLQAEAAGLGLEFTARTTVAELEAMIAGAFDEVGGTETVGGLPPQHPGPNVRFDQGACGVCGKVNDHTHVTRTRGV